MAMLSAYCIERTEVTAADYKACVDAGVCTAPVISKDYPSVCRTTLTADDKPINCIDWGAARTFCGWKGDGTVHASGPRRLPTEAEWERAARGFDQRRFPWGASATVGDQVCVSAFLADCYTVNPIALQPAACSLPDGTPPVGLCNVIGNVAEWTADFYSATYYADYCPNGCIDPAGPPSGIDRVVRGGSFATPVSNLSDGTRAHRQPALASGAIGIRCALSPPP
jgi:formylglycine-generating enzyme required for sulfatase activity